ncbi:two-component system cit operon sensor histidine kinase CitA [Celerinatantimonas diazotrophica]|uniref:histidine kinase n=2 Tax=Celerinatantimonas diazotrophica TaxID=412034 RepID=A0A4R1K1M6_9GAMM|nr:two-component system cit operon sensor histidine kinase CitA [Celerinatantimonas diazotrophica]
MKKRLPFHIRLFIYLSLFTSLLIVIMTMTFSLDFDHLFFSQIRSKAEIQSNQIAHLKSLIQAIEDHDKAAIKAIMNPLAQESDASYLVIGDNHARHLYHSNPPPHMSLYMVGGDNKPVLAGKHIVTIRKGGMGFSLRSKTPIFNAQHQVIGIASVGYLIKYIEKVSYAKLDHVLYISIIALACLFTFIWFFSKNMKKHMFSMEPDEIAYLVRQQKVLLENIYEGVIAIDSQLTITHINQSARKTFEATEKNKIIIGEKISNLITDCSLLNKEEMEENDISDQLLMFNNKPVIASRNRLFLDNKLLGWVISFRDKDDINSLTQKLSQVKKYADNLRILRHEQLNWTATLAGLLHLGKYQEAIQYIELQSSDTQGVLDFVSKRFTSPYLCGLLLGKYSKAKEKGVVLEFDPACELRSKPDTLTETEFMSIIGNLIDNAIEATLKSEQYEPINIYLSENNNEFIIDISDQGIGIDESKIDNLFTKGVTSKKDKVEHGLGLHLVSNYVSKANGYLEFTPNSPKGVRCSIFIPKQL